MKIALTGADGFLGRRLRSLFIQLYPEIEIIELTRSTGWDISNRDHWDKATFSCDIMIHLAARTFIPDSYANPLAHYETNMIGTLFMLEWCRKNHVRVLSAGSYLYGMPLYYPIDELHPLQPSNPYAESKFLSEHLCAAYARDFNMNCTVLRIFNIYGPNQGNQFLISKIIQGAHKGEIVHLEDPSPKRDYVYIDDVCSAMMKAVLTPVGDGFKVYNIGYGKSYTISEVVNEVARHYPHLQVTFNNHKRKNEIPDTLSNIDKARTELRWEPKYCLQQGIAKSVQLYKYDSAKE